MSEMREDIKTVERNINQLRGYFQSTDIIDIIKVNALRMLDELEIIIKRHI